METTFKLVLNSNFKNQTTLVSKDCILLVTSEPVYKYGKWYYRLLNKITLGKKFCEGWEHCAEKISK